MYYAAYPGSEKYFDIEVKYLQFMQLALHEMRLAAAKGGQRIKVPGRSFQMTSLTGLSCALRPIFSPFLFPSILQPIFPFKELCHLHRNQYFTYSSEATNIHKELGEKKLFCERNLKRK